MRILRPDDLADRLGVSRTTLWRWEQAGHLPRRRAIGPNVAGWPEGEIAKWIEDRPTRGPDESGDGR